MPAELESVRTWFKVKERVRKRKDNGIEAFVGKTKFIFFFPILVCMCISVRIIEVNDPL